MNKLITSLSNITSAAEYFDKKTGAAWKIRSNLTNAAVWAANGYIYAVESDDTERQMNTMVQLATIRCWIKDINNQSGFTIDLTEGAVRKTLGLDRVTDAHEDAVRVARNKCLQTRNASKFKTYYDGALLAAEKQRRQREDRVETIANLLADTSFAIEKPVANAFERYRFEKAPINIAMGYSVNDEDLYDDSTVERNLDSLAETLGNCLETMYNVCDSELAAAITTDKINRLTAYMAAITSMMKIAGIDTKKLEERRQRLESQIKKEEQLAIKSAEDLDAHIAKSIAQMTSESILAEVQEASKATQPKRTRVKAEV